MGVRAAAVALPPFVALGSQLVIAEARVVDSNLSCAAGALIRFPSPVSKPYTMFTCPLRLCSTQQTRV
jgi:hypothetical protein